MPRVNSWNWIRVPARQVHCLGNLSYKWQNESTLHGSPSTGCCVTHRRGCREPARVGGRGRRRRGVGGGERNCFKCYQKSHVKIAPPPPPPLSTHMSSRRFWERIKNDIIIISSCKRGISLRPDGAGIICKVLLGSRVMLCTCTFVVTFLTLLTIMVKIKTVGNVCRRGGA